MASYYRWSTVSDIPLFLQLINPTQIGATGKTPEVAIRRHRLLDGTVLDGHFWNGAAFTATPTWLPMVEFDAVNWPGLYTYDFDQTAIGTTQVYLIYYRHTSTPVGFNVEEHIVTDEIYIPTSSPAVPVIPGDTVMGRLADMENSTGDVALANADAAWDGILAGHLNPGSTGEALASCSAGQVGARQIDITVEDGIATPIQGVAVDVFDVTNTYHLFRVYTGVTGEVSIAVDDATYQIRLSSSGYSFTVPETLVVTVDAAVTYVGTALGVVVPPVDPALCKIYGSVDNAGGTDMAGCCVEAFASTPQTVGGWQKAAVVASTLTDASGYFEIELVRLTEVRFKISDPDGNELFEQILTVPDAATQALASWS